MQHYQNADRMPMKTVPNKAGAELLCNGFLIMLMNESFE